MKKKRKMEPELDPRRGAFIAARRAELGESQDVFGERFGVAQVTVSRWEKGYPPARKLWKSLADLLEMPAERLFLGQYGDLRLNEPAPLSYVNAENVSTGRLPIAGVLGAGEWLEVQELEGAPVQYLQAPLDSNFPSDAQMAYLVSGDSMDLAGIQDGFYVTAVDFVRSGISLQSGMIVVVQQTRDGGHLRRWLVKELHVFRDHYELRSQSSNKAHQTIRVPHQALDEPTEEIRVLAIVTGAFKKISPFGGSARIR